MSRRRFGDADDTYKDFISAIDDHKRKLARQQEAARLLAQAQQQQQLQAQQAQQAAQQQQAQAQPPAPAPFDLSGEVGGYQSGPYDDGSGGRSLLGQQQGPVLGGRRASEVEDDYATALPVNAMDRDTWPPLPRRQSSTFGLGLGSGGSGTRSPYDDTQPLLDRRKSTSAGPPSDHAWISKRNLDLAVQRKSRLIFANGMFGVALMVAILQVCWEPLWQTRRYGVDMSAPADYYSDLDFVSERLLLQPAPLPRAWTWNAVAAQCPTPVRSYVTEALKMILTLSTLVLCWQILDRKRMQVNLKFREQRRKLKAKGYAQGQERDHLYMSSQHMAQQSNVGMFGLLSLQASAFRWELWLSLIVCLIQPIPFTNQLTGGIVSDKIGLLMWLRLHLLFRVIRDSSEIWLARRSIKHQSAFHEKVPNFDWWLSCKTICYRDPLFFAGWFYLISIFLFAHALYIAERDLLPKFFDFWSSLFVSLQIVSVGWPADVWEIYMPISVLGKLVSLLAGMAGLLLISFVIATVGQTLYPTKFEENALNFIAMEKVRQRERDASARLIQFVWKNAAREAELEAKLAPKNPALYDEISEQEEKQFMEHFIAQSKELRLIRRERAELEERSDPTSERNISPMDQYFDTKLEAIRTDIHHQNAKNQQQFLALLATLNQLVHKQAKEKQKAAQQQAAQQGATGGVGAAPTIGGSGSKKQRAAERSQKQQAAASTAATAPVTESIVAAASVPTSSPTPPPSGAGDAPSASEVSALPPQALEHVSAVMMEQARADEDAAAFRRTLTDSIEQQLQSERLPSQADQQRLQALLQQQEEAYQARQGAGAAVGQARSQQEQPEDEGQPAASPGEESSS